MPHRTADRRVVAPTLMIVEVIGPLAEIGAPEARHAAQRIDEADASAAKPCGGSRWMILRPSVRTKRHPPDYVPALMSNAAEILTQLGIYEPFW